MNPILSFGPVVWRNILNYIEYSAKAIKKGGFKNSSRRACDLWGKYRNTG
jgi:hypothetical protein